MNLIKYLYRQSSSLLALCVIFAILSGLGGTALIKVISEGVSGKSQSPVFALEFFALCFGLLIVRSGSQIAILYLTQNAVLGMRIELSKKLLDSPYRKLQALGKPGLLVILTRDIETFVNALQVAPRVLTDGVVIIFSFAYLAWLSWTLFLILAMTLPVCLVAFHFAQRYPFSQLKKIRAKLDLLFKHFRDLIESSRELQLNKQRGRLFIEKVIGPDAADFRNIFIRGFSSYIWISNIGDMLFYIATGTLLFVVPLWLPQRAEVLTSVTLVLLYLVGPISSMINAVPAFGQAGIALRKIQQLDTQLNEDVTPTHEMNPFQAGASLVVAMENVRHCYSSQTDDSKFLLGPLNFDIRQSEVLFIVGGNGSGKTTLAMLLLGLYMPDSGQICMNGVAVTESNIEHYRQNFSAVFSDVHLFEHLLEEDLQAAKVQTLHYLSRLSMDHKVKVVDGKFSTIDLSSGQKKRLALIASYLEDKPIYLFDEWAADQDPAFKRVFYTELLPELKARGKTIVVISHDDAYFHCADRIIKLEDGHVSSFRATNA